MKNFCKYILIEKKFNKKLDRKQLGSNMNIFMFQKVRGFWAKNPASWVNGQILKVKKK